MTKKTERDNERTEAIAKLRKMLKPGMTVHTVLRHVSGSGMTRRISCIIPTTRKDRDGKRMLDVMQVDWLVARACGDKIHRDGGYALNHNWL